MVAVAIAASGSQIASGSRSYQRRGVVAPGALSPPSDIGQR
jgi:hypothetical protein